MVFVNTNKKDQELGAAFQQNSLRRGQAGDEAEVSASTPCPPRIQREGAERAGRDRRRPFQATGTLVDFGARTEGGRALAVIDITDDMSDCQIPLGAAGQAAIYTEHWHHVSLLREDPAAHAKLGELRVP